MEEESHPDTDATDQAEDEKKQEYDGKYETHLFGSKAMRVLRAHWTVNSWSAKEM
ncbi:MAG: hypothetical protein KDA90_23100 [Planctomycetaceae bacterium]|nr:hypothetical protein [Planctomycetaceae bacterium]